MGDKQARSQFAETRRKLLQQLLDELKVVHEKRRNGVADIGIIMSLHANVGPSGGSGRNNIMVPPSRSPSQSPALRQFNAAKGWGDEKDKQKDKDKETRETRETRETESYTSSLTSALPPSFSSSLSVAASSKSGPWHILPNLILGNVFHAKDIRSLRRMGVTHVLNLAPDSVSTDVNFYSGSAAKQILGFMRIPAYDTVEFNLLLDVMPRSVNFIAHALKNVSKLKSSESFDSTDNDRDTDGDLDDSMGGFQTPSALRSMHSGAAVAGGVQAQPSPMAVSLSPSSFAEALSGGMARTNSNIMDISQSQLVVQHSVSSSSSDQSPPTSTSESTPPQSPMVTSTSKSMRSLLQSPSVFPSNSHVVFVHCLAGMNRSVAVIVGYLMEYENMDLFQAVKLVSIKRGNQILTNPAFQQQLVELSMQLDHV